MAYNQYPGYGYGMYNNGMQTNPYVQRLNDMMQQTQHYEIIHVNGENGAKSFRMAPNSQCLLLDDTAPIVWLCVSDGAGYHTATPYTIEPYQAAPAQDYAALNARISRLEETLYEKSDAASSGAVQTASANTNVGT